MGIMRFNIIIRQILFLVLSFSITVVLVMLFNDSPAGQPIALRSEVYNNPLTLSARSNHHEQEQVVWIKDSHNFITSSNELDKRTNFTTEGDDVLVFLHIQKTGGTFLGKNLVKNLALKRECECHKESDSMLKCPCYSLDGRKLWMFSRYSTGWKCGLHADFTELTECLTAGKLDELEELERNRRYYMFTMLREPLQRYVSEWQHVSTRGTAWHTSTLRCNGESPTSSDLPQCFTADSWLNVTLEQFTSCSTNLARNRQTRMLANLSLIKCYQPDMMTDPYKRKIILTSAKTNLRELPYFALMPYLEESQFLFEQTFGLKFRKSFLEQRNRHNRNSEDYLRSLSRETIHKLREVNDLDIELHEYAKDLFFRRYRYYKNLMT